MKRLLCFIGVMAVSVSAAGQVPAPAGAVLYEGARLITGDGSAPIERAAFLVQNGRFVRVGRQGDVPAPAGARRVDLTGRTVMPALVDAHSHIGYMKHLTSGPQNYTRENILDHMHRFAYFGVAASQAMGTDFGELPFQIRDELAAGTDPDAALFLTAGRGLAPLDEISPANMHHAAYAVTTVEGARADVQELALRKVPLIKMWVDSRGGTMKTLTPDLYGAILDEAHRRRLRVAVHATDLAEAKQLLRAGIDVFAHMIADVDDELVALFRQHPDTAVLLALCAPRRIVSAPWLEPVHPLIRETVRPEQIARLHDRLAGQTPETVERGRQAWERLARGVRLLAQAGVKIGLGTDGGGQNGDQFVGWTAHAELENMVAAGMTPMQALVAATRNSAEILGLSDLGVVAAGKSADFVVLDANPLDEITNTRRISQVFLRGREVNRARLRAGWAAGLSSN
ncbi:MAG: amidohydrolase family protein [Acidobacteria bacterium]|nr:amidohydrolase family protein [Acidobacteriota bacterium]